MREHHLQRTLNRQQQSSSMKSWFVPGLIIAGLILIVIALIIPSRSIDSIGKKTLAVVTEVSGSALVEGLDQTDTSDIQKKTKIKNLDLIKTKERASTTIVLEGVKSEVRILENSVILFEENTEGVIVLTIKEGDLVIEDIGAPPEDGKVPFWIKKEGRQLSALDYILVSDSSHFQKSSVPEDTNPDILTQAKIEEILNTKKNDFFRCYGQLVQKNEQAHGQLLLSFEILNTGKVQTVSFSKSDLNQPFFLSCLKEVVLRTSFPPFSGKPITTVFPLKFE